MVTFQQALRDVARRIDTYRRSNPPESISHHDDPDVIMFDAANLLRDAAAVMDERMLAKDAEAARDKEARRGL